MILTLILIVLVVFCSIPLSYIVSWYARDELILGRKWFLLISYMCAFGALFYFIMVDVGINEFAFGSSMIFVGMFSYTAYIKSFDKKWTKVRKR
jgi:hypothetical protein